MPFAKNILITLLLGILALPGTLRGEEALTDAPGESVGANTEAPATEVRKKASKDDQFYAVEETGRSTWRVLFDKQMDTPEAQWEYAKKTYDKNDLKKADRRMLYLYRRWPNSRQAPWAARVRADILFQRKEWVEAFDAYQNLIDNYSSRMRDYDSVLERQFEIATRIMNRRRMRWLFGGYRAPEYAVEYFEKVIRNGPQWSRAPEAQFMVGQCHQEAEEYELAITAYRVLGYRYPDSEYAEEAAWQQIQCLGKLRDEFPNSPEILNRILTASTVFLSTFPESDYRNEIIQLRNDLYEVKAQRVFDEAAFYANVPKEPQAAIIYYEKMIEEYPKSKLVPYAKERIAELEAILAMPEEARKADAPRSKPLPFTRGSENGDG